MKKPLSLLSVLALGACVYGTPINQEGLYDQMDLTKIDWAAINKSGSSCQTNILFMIPLGDNSLPTAVKSAKIEKLSYVDTDYTLYFPVMSRECTNVWGIGHDLPVMDLPVIPEPVATDAKPAEKSAKKSKKSEKAAEPITVPAPEATTTEKK